MMIIDLHSSDDACSSSTVDIGSKCSALEHVKFVCNPLINSTGVLCHSMGLDKESSGVHERPVGLHI